MRITYVARSFLDYRIPVLEHLNRLCRGQLQFISSTKWTPQRALDRLQKAIGENAIYLSREKSIGVDVPSKANKNISIPYQPGLLSTIQDTRPDVLVGDGFFQWTYAPLLLRIIKQVPLVVCYERWAHTERDAQWYRKLYRKIALRFIGAVCCNGILSKEYTISLGAPPDHIVTGHMAADTDTLAEASSKVTAEEKNKLQSGHQLDGIVFLCVGQLIQRKGVAQLLDAWSIFENSVSNATLLIVGDGPEIENLKRQQERLGLKHVRFTGPVDYSRIANFYAASDIFIIPTLEDNWSLVVPEAMACGLPILCSKFNGCWPELVREGVNGWVFDPLNEADIQRVLLETVNSGNQLQAMGERSKEIVADHTPQKAAEAIFTACEIALA